MAQENRTWGYDRILGALSNLGHTLAANTVANILRRHGIGLLRNGSEKQLGKEFLWRHFDQIAATDFFSVDVWTRKDCSVSGAFLHRTLVPPS